MVSLRVLRPPRTLSGRDHRFHPPLQSQVQKSTQIEQGILIDVLTSYPNFLFVIHLTWSFVTVLAFLLRRNIGLYITCICIFYQRASGF